MEFQKVLESFCGMDGWVEDWAYIRFAFLECSHQQNPSAIVSARKRLQGSELSRGVARVGCACEHLRVITANLALIVRRVSHEKSTQDVPPLEELRGLQVLVHQTGVLID